VDDSKRALFGAIKKSRLLAIICLGISSGIFVFGFWPFCYKPINTAWLLDDGKGIASFWETLLMLDFPGSEISMGLCYMIAL